MLIISAMLVLVVVLAIAGLALWMGVFQLFEQILKMRNTFMFQPYRFSVTAIIGFSCSIRIVRGERYNPMLKLNTSMVFREKERKFKNIFELLFRRSVLGLSYKQTMIDKFENGTLKVFFRLYLDRRKIPRSIVNVEDTIQDIIAKETYSISSLFKDIELDLTSTSVKRINQENIVNQKQGQQKHTMITKNGLLRPNRNSSLIMSSKSKTKPTKTDSEPNIDFNNIPTIQGTYRATKINITAENSTKEISEPIIDNKGLATTKRMPLQKHTTTSEKVLNRVESSPTDVPSTLFTKSTTAMVNKDKLNEKQENEMKTTSSGTTTVRSDLNIFKDFLNPDFENNSPWKPIVPGYVNTEFKLLPNDDVKKTSYTESTTRTAISRTSDFRDNVKMPNDETSTTPTVPKLPLDSVNFRDVSEINTFDIDNTDFPRDRIDPGLIKSNNHEKLDIEVAGQLPSEMYSVKLKASSYDGNERVISNSESSITRGVPENISIQNNAFQEKKHKDSNATRKTEAKFDNSASSMEPNEKIMNDSFTSGVGVAEPVLDTEIELEAKNRYRGSSILALTTDEDMLRNRKVNINQQPIYTSYNTPDLNGGSLGSSLIENPATTKPFRHTIPVDKITSVVNYSINVPFDNLDAPPLSDDTSTDEKLFQDKVLTPLPPKRIIEIETSVVEHDDTIAQLQSGQITSIESSIVKDDNKSYFSTTESYSEPKLIAKDSSGKRGVSRNSTFVEIDTVKHTPDGELEENWESHADEVTVNNDELHKKKVYNETLKAYVVENLVTLAPVKSNTGIGRPVRPRPKIDFPDTTLLEQLFGVRDYMHDRDTTNTDESTTESSSSHKIQNSTKSDEKNSNHKSTIVEQIVEVVTSISTRVSSNIKSDPVILKFIVTNSTNPVVHSEKSSTSNNEADKSSESAVNTTETILSNNLNLSEMLQSQDHELSLDIEELKKIADVVTGNETLKNASSEFTLSRDGVEIFTKILNKEEDETYARETHTVPTIQKLSKTNAHIDEWKSISLQSSGSFCNSCIGFLCGDGKCLDSSAICNMLVECPGAEDEANCTCADFLKTQLLYQKICDGIADCWDYSDENNCDWCEKGQFVCGNSKSCVDTDKVCNGFSDCPGGEDEKKCTALIDNEENIAESRIDLVLTKNLSKNHSEMVKHLDQVIERDTTTLYILPNNLQSERLINDKNGLSSKLINQELTRNRDVEESNIEVAVSSRETSSNVLRNGLIPGNNLHAKDNRTFPVAKVYNNNEIDNYNNKGILSVRKNGKWGKLCFINTNSLTQEQHARQVTWSIEDLAKAACKAITYQDYEMVEKVLDQNPPLNQFYYTLSYDKSDLSDRTALSFKSSQCPSGEVLKIRCKNFECGIRTQVASTARIVGGASSSVGNWPWQVALYKDGNYQCGGALINDRWVISAGHCFYHAQNNYWVARIGATRRGSFRSPHEQLLRVDYISLHPDYVDHVFLNDIAVIRLEQAVNFSDYIRPVCLPKAPVLTGTVCVVTGWGQLYEIGRVFPDTLQEVQIPVMSTEDCRRKTLFLPLYRITNGMLCAGLENGGKDACLGDSGGPLVCLSPFENRYVLQGITSNGYGCGRRERPGVYTKIYSYMSYIDYVITQKDIQPSAVEFCKGHRCPLGECLPKSRVCNGFLECSDGSDERDCSTISR
ncbi:Enteropeptidase [Trachymyrmex cornetzi]|uniref:Enteropeptidase n=1 Tax=Trachymyrmex cornetzi TaxID=471704 RepID=A0A195E7U2_9HYME|nr:Enteropeptidase [Trachymyrmex cornetzi]